MSGAPACYDPSGALIACADGPELIAYSGADGTPLWKHFLQGILVGLGICGDTVIGVDTDGHVQWWRRLDGALVREARLDIRCRGLVWGGPDGLCAVLGERHLAMVARTGDFDLISVEGLCAGAFAPPGLLLGFDNGVLELRDPATGEASAVLPVGAHIHAIAWTTLGYFVVTAGNDLLRVEHTKTAARPAPSAPSPDGQLPVAAPPSTSLRLTRTSSIGGAARALSVNEDGVLAAFSVAELSATVVELGEVQPVARITSQRPIVTLGFGPKLFLALATDDAEFTRVDLATGALLRPLAGLGRVPSTWPVQVDVQSMALRGALARVKAGGQQIATRVERGGFFDEVGGEPGSKKRWWLMGCGATALLAGCCGCGSSALYYFW